MLKIKVEPMVPNKSNPKRLFPAGDETWLEISARLVLAGFNSRKYPKAMLEAMIVVNKVYFAIFLPKTNSSVLFFRLEVVARIDKKIMGRLSHFKIVTNPIEMLSAKSRTQGEPLRPPRSAKISMSE